MVTDGLTADQRKAIMQRKKYAVCGLSDRAINLLVLPIVGNPAYLGDGDDFSGVAELVAIIDIDPIRVQRFQDTLGLEVPYYQPGDFGAMVDACAPDTVIVAGPDATHAGFAVAALARGLDVIVEKPLASTATDARAVLDAEASSPGKVLVGHNFRYEAAIRRLRSLVASGAVGRVVAVDLVWGVDTYHGASYFWRWNRLRANSGGLSVHKSCHHLDMVSWVIQDSIESVFAFGARNFYGAASPHRPHGADGEELPAELERAASPYHHRWRGSALPEHDDHFIGPWQAMGYPAQYPEGSTRYIFDAEIDIEDTYSAALRFRGGASMSYALTFSSPWEGYRMGITGTHGRIETEDVYFRGGPSAGSQRIEVMPLFGPRESVEIAPDTGAHGGADKWIRRDLIGGPSAESVREGLPASSLQAALAVAAGEALWRSVQEERPVGVAELLRLDQVPSWDGVPSTPTSSAS